MIPKFNLQTHDIAGAVPRDLKYKDKGKKKANFFPQSNIYRELNQYYNKESVGGGNSVMDLVIKVNNEDQD